MATRILNLGSSWRLVVNNTLRPLRPGGQKPVPTEKEAGWAPQPVWAF